MKSILFAFVAFFGLAACSNNQPSTATPSQDNEATVVINFEEAHNYFFKNNQQIPENPKITTAEEFNTLFGMATVMGSNGKPTEIDFDKQMVLAIVLPVTDVTTEIIPIKVEEKDDVLYYTYQLKSGDKQSFTSQPISIIILDKKYADKEVKLLSEQ